MSLRNYFFLFAIFSVTFSFSQSTDYEWSWATRGGGARHLISGSNYQQDPAHLQKVRDIAIDTLNNYYFLADVGSGDSYNPDVTFGTIPNDTILIPTYNDPFNTPNYNSRDSYLVSTTCDGEFRWQKTMGAGGNVGSYDVKADSLGGIYMVGNMPRHSAMQTPVHYDQDSIKGLPIRNGMSPNNKMMYMIKYDMDGTFQWLKEPQEDDLYWGADIPGGAISNGLYMEPDGTSHWLVYLLNQTLEDGTVVPNSTYFPRIGRDVGDLMVLKYDKDGSFIDYVRLDIVTNLLSPIGKSTSFEYDPVKKQYYVSILQEDSNGEGWTAIDGVDVTGGLCLVAFDADDGSVAWWHENITHGGGILDMVLDNHGDLYLTGGIGMDDNFAGHVTPYGISGPFVIKLNSDGQLLWGTHAETPLFYAAESITINEDEVFIGLGLGPQIVSWGVHWDGLEFWPPADHGTEPAVIRFDKQTGSAIKIHEILSSGFGDHDQIRAVAVDKQGSIVVGGLLRSAWIFENDPIVPQVLRKTANPSDFFIAKLAKDGVDCSDYLSVADVSEPLGYFKVFPNPTDTMVHWQSNESIISLSLYDVSGRELIHESVFDSQGSISLEGLSSGTYILMLQTETGQRMQRQIIKK